MKLKVIIFILAFLLPVFYEFYRRQNEMDYVHRLPKGSISILQQQLPSTNSPITLLHQQNQTQFLFNQKSIFRSNQLNFVTLLKSKGQIVSDGDSTYHIKDEPQMVCVQQVITQISSSSNGLIIKGQFSDCDESEYEVEMKPLEKQLIIMGRLKSKKYNRIKLSFNHLDSSHYYGLGQQFSHLSLGKNRPYSLFVREKGVGRTQQPETMIINFLHKAGGSYYNSYNPSPIWLSTQKIGYLLDSYAYAIWMNNQILVWDQEMKVHMFHGDNFKQILKQISQINGYTNPVPAWVNEGAILGLQGNTSSVLDKYNKIKQQGAIVRGIWIQDWVSKRHSLGYSRLWWNWELDEDHYAGWHQMTNKLHQDKVKTLIYMNPMLVDAKEKNNAKRNLYEEGIKNKSFVLHHDGKLFKTASFSDWKAALVDFYNPNGKDFYQNLVRDSMMSTGAFGMMSDFSEAYPVENTHSSLEEAIKYHNEYPVKFHQSTMEIFDSLPNAPQIYTFTRAGYLRAPKYTHSLWAGDQSMNFKKHAGLPSCLTAILSSGLIGYSNTHCDIGGYIFYRPMSIRSEILMERWMQLAAFSPVFRSHEGNAPDQTIQIYSNTKMLSLFSLYSQIYSLLANYRSAQAKRSQEQRIPLMRPMFLEVEDERVYKIADQYYLGDDILVSPLLKEKNSRKYYLPKGKWVNIFTREKVEGCDCEMEGVSQYPIVHIKEDSPFKDEILERLSRAMPSAGGRSKQQL